MPAHHRPVYTKTHSAARHSGRDCAFSSVIYTETSFLRRASSRIKGTRLHRAYTTVRSTSTSLSLSLSLSLSRGRRVRELREQRVCRMLYISNSEDAVSLRSCQQRRGLFLKRISKIYMHLGICTSIPRMLMSPR